MAGRIETPRYTVVSENEGFEVRQYDAMVVAETEVDGSIESSGNAGFRRLGGYIFGGNAREQKISMTAPVGQQATPNGRWRVTFTMPAQHRLADLPGPADPNVHLTHVESRPMAAITFRGFWDQDNVMARAAHLEAQVRAAGLEPSGPPVFARYDPPWTPPFLRRNEVLLPLKQPLPPKRGSAPATP
jgi:hypothetical protein